jgi:hypothetical protein
MGRGRLASPGRLTCLRRAELAPNLTRRIEQVLEPERAAASAPPRGASDRMVARVTAPAPAIPPPAVTRRRF